jgi:hypothetical protein
VQVGEQAGGSQVEDGVEGELAGAVVRRLAAPFHPEERVRGVLGVEFEVVGGRAGAQGVDGRVLEEGERAGERRRGRAAARLNRLLPGGAGFQGGGHGRVLVGERLGKERGKWGGRNRESARVGGRSTAPPLVLTS